MGLLKFDDGEESVVGKGKIGKEYSVDVDLSCGISTGVFDKSKSELCEGHYSVDITEEELDLIVKYVPSVYEKIHRLANRLRWKASQDIATYGDKLYSCGNGWDVEDCKKVVKTEKKSGFVYLLRVDGENVVKIGLTTQKVDKRVCGIKTNTFHDIDLVGYIHINDVFAVEKKLHETFKEKKIKREWFSLKVEEAIEGYKKFGEFVVAS